MIPKYVSINVGWLIAAIVVEIMQLAIIAHLS